MAWSALALDRSITITVLNRAWIVIAGPATLALVALYLSPMEQGFYYVFSSVLGLQVFFELGLGFAVMQTVSHLMAGLVANRAGVTGDAAARARLGRLLADVLRWYAIVSALFIGLILFGGAWFLGSNPDASLVSWQLPWAMVVPLFGLSIVVNVVFSFLEGIGFVANVALARLLQSIVGISGLCWSLLTGQKLMAVVVFHALNLLIGAVWIWRHHGPMLRDILRSRGPQGTFDWRRELWPFQWRIAASWAGGYCGSQAITLILFQRLDAEQAGRFGLTLAALGALASGASAWVTTKAPRFGGLVAAGSLADLDHLYRSAFRGAMTVGTIGAVLLLVIVASLDALNLPLAQRFVATPALLAMTLAMLVNLRIAAQASFFRAFRQEPFLVLSISAGVAQVVAALILTSLRDATVVAIGYAAVTIVIGLFWAPAVYARVRSVYMRG